MSPGEAVCASCGQPSDSATQPGPAAPDVGETNARRSAGDLSEIENKVDRFLEQTAPLRIDAPGRFIVPVWATAIGLIGCTGVPVLGIAVSLFLLAENPGQAGCFLIFWCLMLVPCIAFFIAVVQPTIVTHFARAQNHPGPHDPLPRLPENQTTKGNDR